MGSFAPQVALFMGSWGGHEIEGEVEGFTGSLSGSLLPRLGGRGGRGLTQVSEKAV